MTKSFTGRRTINEKKYKTKKSHNNSENTTEEMKKILEDSQSDINVSRQQMGMNTMQPQMPMNMDMMQQQMPMNMGMNMMQPQMPMNMGMNMMQPQMPMNNMMQPQMPMTSAGEIDPLMVNTIAPVNMNQNSMMQQHQLLSGAQMAQNVNVMSEQRPMMPMMQPQMSMMQPQMPMMQQQMPMMGHESLNINAIKNLSGLNTMKMI
jgi:hypothetical protein